MAAELNIVTTLLKLIIIIIGAKVAGWLFDKIKQPPVLGELMVGILLGPSLFNFIIPGKEPVLSFIAEIGAILLLFIVGLESNLYQLVKVGLDSTLVACIGVVVPFALGFLYFYFSGYTPLLSIFVGATLTATSVGVTTRVLSDMKKVKANESRIIIGAAVIDDILGLIILAVVVGVAAKGAVSIFEITKISFISLAFLAASIFVGIKFVPLFNKLANKLDARRTYVISAFSFAVIFGIAANSVGLATIVGAFAAGLILERTENKQHYEQRMKPIADLFVPVFFVMTGIAMDVHSLFNIKILILTAVVFVIAVIGKIVAGIGVIKTKANRLIVGLGMIPRGEVGLIFASYGLSHSIFTSDVYSSLIVVIMLSTLCIPSILSFVKNKFTIPEGESA